MPVTGSLVYRCDGMFERVHSNSQAALDAVSCTAVNLLVHATTFSYLFNILKLRFLTWGQRFKSSPGRQSTN
jgi:hypothetical protein